MTLYDETRTMQAKVEGYVFDDMTWQQSLTVELLGYHHECIPCIDATTDGCVIASYRDNDSGEHLGRYNILPGASYDRIL